MEIVLGVIDKIIFDEIDIVVDFERVEVMKNISFCLNILIFVYFKLCDFDYLYL